MRKLTTLIAGAALLASPAAMAASATATLQGADGSELGTVTLQDTASGMVHVMAELSGMPAGEHGFHIHETGACDGADGFKSAGGHLAGDMDHGVMAEGGPHPGDFPNIHVPDSGALTIEYFTDRISLGEGEGTPVMDQDGSAVMVHAGADDYESQPSGDAGDRIACGVIEATE